MDEKVGFLLSPQPCNRSNITGVAVSVGNRHEESKSTEIGMAS